MLVRHRITIWKSVVFRKSTQTNTEDQLLGFIRNAGYLSPTLLQKTVLPLTLLRRDMVIEAGSGEGRTGLFLISLLMQTEGSGKGITNLIVTTSADEVNKILRQYRRFSARLTRRPRIVGLGTDENVEQELKILSGNPDIAAGTSERIIDHLRRKNITLQYVRNVILVFPESPEPEGFQKMCCIYIRNFRAGAKPKRTAPALTRYRFWELF